MGCGSGKRAWWCTIGTDKSAAKQVSPSATAPIQSTGSATAPVPEPPLPDAGHSAVLRIPLSDEARAYFEKEGITSQMEEMLTSLANSMPVDATTFMRGYLESKGKGTAEASIRSDNAESTNFSNGSSIDSNSGQAAIKKCASHDEIVHRSIVPAVTCPSPKRPGQGIVGQMSLTTESSEASSNGFLTSSQGFSNPKQISRPSRRVRRVKTETAINLERGRERLQKEAEEESDGSEEAEIENQNWRFSIFCAEKQIASAHRSMFENMPAVAQSNDNDNEVQLLHSFLPRTIKQAILWNQIMVEDLRAVSSGSKTFEPIVSSFDACVVFADASGFTKLTEQLSQQIGGAEKMGSCLNGFFGPLIGIVNSYGGDIIKFSGDALTIIWPASMDPVTSENRLAGNRRHSSNASREQLQNATAAASSCCLEIQARVDSFGATPVPGLALTMHIGVGAGRLSILQVGGLFNRWEYCVAGAPLEQIAIAEPLAHSGETCLSPEASILLIQQNGFELEEVDAPAHAGPGYHKLISCRGGPVKPPCILQEPQTTRDWAKIDKRLLRRFIPAAVVRSLQASRGTEVTCAEEMRRVSVVFLSLKGLDPSTKEGSKQAQDVMFTFQRSVYAQEGSINKFLVDDKGILVLACFGLPPLNHFFDDPLRALLAATRMVDCLKEEQLVGQAGVSTGKVWCGVVGSPTRREYTVLGDLVNLSARLMASAKAGTVLCDSATAKSCAHALEFKELTPIMVKGKSEPIPIFLPSGKEAPRDPKLSLNTCLLSWAEWPARKRLVACLDDHREKSGVLFIRGGPGSGKTELREAVRCWAESNGWTLLQGQNMNPLKTFSVPLLCWQEVFKSLVKIANTLEVFERRMALKLQGSKATGAKNAQKSLPSLYQLLCCMLEEVKDGDLLPWVPLLEMVLPRLEFGGEVVSAMMENDRQHERTNRFSEICAAVVDAFSRHCTGPGRMNSKDSNAANADTQPQADESRPDGGTIVLLHLKRSTSFMQSQDPQTLQIVRAVAELCERRRKQPDGAPPLLLCVISRQGILEDGYLVKLTQTRGSLIDTGKLTEAETREYSGQLFAFYGKRLSRRPSRDPSNSGLSAALSTGHGSLLAPSPSFRETQTRRGSFSQMMAEAGPAIQSTDRPKVPRAVAEYIYKTTAGHLQGIESICKQLLSEGMVRLETTPMGNELIIRKGVGPAELLAMALPEKLVGMTMAQFEQFDPMAQQVLKAASMFEDVFSAAEVCAAMQLPLDQVEKSIKDLVKQGILAEESEEVLERQYRFQGDLLRRMASTLVLHSHREKARKSVSQHLGASGAKRMSTMVQSSLLASDRSGEASSFMVVAENSKEDLEDDDEGSWHHGGDDSDEDEDDDALAVPTRNSWAATSLGPNAEA